MRYNSDSNCLKDGREGFLRLFRWLWWWLRRRWVESRCRRNDRMCLMTPTNRLSIWRSIVAETSMYLHEYIAAADRPSAANNIVIIVIATSLMIIFIHQNGRNK